MSWKKPVEVMGYNNAVHFFGSVFEAETNCISAHNMGQVNSVIIVIHPLIHIQVASAGVNNFSFFSRKAAITSSEASL